MKYNINFQKVPPLFYPTITAQSCKIINKLNILRRLSYNLLLIDHPIKADDTAYNKIKKRDAHKLDVSKIIIPFIEGVDLLTDDPFLPYDVFHQQSCLPV